MSFRMPAIPIRSPSLSGETDLLSSIGQNREKISQVFFSACCIPLTSASEELRGCRKHQSIQWTSLIENILEIDQIWILYEPLLITIVQVKECSKLYEQRRDILKNYGVKPTPYIVFFQSKIKETFTDNGDQILAEWLKINPYDSVDGPGAYIMPSFRLAQFYFTLKIEKTTKQWSINELEYPKHLIQRFSLIPKQKNKKFLNITHKIPQLIIDILMEVEALRSFPPGLVPIIAKYFH